MTGPAPITGPLFDAYAFALKVRTAAQRAGGVREAARQSGVSAPTISRVTHGWSDLSHENYLRLEAWMHTLQEPVAA